MIYNEKEINLSIKCSLLDISSINDPFITSNLVLNWVLVQSFVGKIVPLNLIRKKFESFWTRDFIGDKTGKEFYSGLRIGNGISNKIFQLLLKYEVVKPVEKYNLPQNNIEGEYALLKEKSKKNNTVYILYTQNKKDKYSKYPTMISLLRWFHAFTMTDYTDIEVLNFYLSDGSTLISKNFNLDKITYILSFSHIFYLYINSGVHCDSCVSKKCLRLINVKI